jgi:glycosyltransferase involved in cell wall biosynthesis
VRYLIVGIIPYAVNENNQYEVAEMWGLDLATHLKYFNDLHVFCPRAERISGYVYKFPQDSGIVFHQIPNPGHWVSYLFNIPRILYLYYRNIKNDDLVHATGAAYPPFGILATIFCLIIKHKTHILVIDGDDLGDMDVYLEKERKNFGKINKLLIKLFYEHIFDYCISRTPIVFVVGDNLYNKYKKYHSVRKIYASWIRDDSIISDALLMKKLDSFDANKNITIIFAARLVATKGPDIAVEVLRILRDRKIPAILDIYGEGKMLGKITELINDYNLNDTVFVRGVVPYDYFNKILSTYDIIIIPDISGDQPRILFDAMANGTGIVGSDISAFRDIIENKKNGLLCDPRHPELFADAIEKLYKDRDLLKDIITEGSKCVRNNTIETMHRNRKEIIDKIFYNKTGEGRSL